MPSKQDKVKRIIKRYLFHEESDIYGDADVTQLLEELSVLGVVIKVDRELPENPIDTKYTVMSEKRYTYGQAQQDMLKAGYVVVEPLI